MLYPPLPWPTYRKAWGKTLSYLYSFWDNIWIWEINLYISLFNWCKYFAITMFLRKLQIATNATNRHYSWWWKSFRWWEPVWRYRGQRWCENYYLGWIGDKEMRGTFVIYVIYEDIEEEIESYSINTGWNVNYFSKYYFFHYASMSNF